MVVMTGIVTFVVGFAILWLGIKFLASPIGGVESPDWGRSFLWTLVIWFISYVVMLFLMGWMTPSGA